MPLVNSDGTYLTTGGKYQLKDHRDLSSPLPFSWVIYPRVSTKHGTEQNFFPYVSTVTQIIFLNSPPPHEIPLILFAYQVAISRKQEKRNNTEASPEGKCNPNKKNAVRRKYKKKCKCMLEKNRWTKTPRETKGGESISLLYFATSELWTLSCSSEYQPPFPSHSTY